MFGMWLIDTISFFAWMFKWLNNNNMNILNYVCLAKTISYILEKTLFTWGFNINEDSILERNNLPKDQISRKKSQTEVKYWMLLIFLGPRFIYEYIKSHKSIGSGWKLNSWESKYLLCKNHFLIQGIISI